MAPNSIDGELLLRDIYHIQKLSAALLEEVSDLKQGASIERKFVAKISMARDALAEAYEILHKE